MAAKEREVQMDEVLRRMLSTPHSPNAPLPKKKKVTSKPKKSATRVS